MTSSTESSRAVAKYVALIDKFLAGTLTAREFQAAYLRTLKDEPLLFANDVFDAIQGMFSDADSYVEDPQLRTEPEDLDENQLRQCAVRARNELRALGFH